MSSTRSRSQPPGSRPDAGEPADVDAIETQKPLPGHAFAGWCEITLTSRCNQRCFFCYEDQRTLTPDPERRDVEALLRAVAEENEQVVLCGKEVLLRPDVLDVVAYAHGLKLRVAVFSNGQALAREGLVDALAKAGCDSLVVSFHFPDAESFARGSRSRASGFERSLLGLSKVRDFHLERPADEQGKAMDLAVETDISALNVGRLEEMRARLLEALSPSPWTFRVGSLLPVPTHDIGLGHALGPFRERQEEIAALVKSQPDGIPLVFVKTPLCLLPPGEEHRAQEIGYVYEGTLLTFNHQTTTEITVDPYSISGSRDLAAILRAHPYRWICRSCPLLSLCRFERVSWDYPLFAPRRDQRPAPRTQTTTAEVLARLGPTPAVNPDIDRALTALQATPYPEEALLSELSLPRDQAPRLVDAWAEGPPLLQLLFEDPRGRCQLHLRPPQEPVSGRVLDYVVDCWELSPQDCEEEAPSEQLLEACLSRVASAPRSAIDEWRADSWFDDVVAETRRYAWDALGPLLWPRLGRTEAWTNIGLRAQAPGALVIAFKHRGGALAEVEVRGPEASENNAPAGSTEPGPTSSPQDMPAERLGALLLRLRPNRANAAISGEELRDLWASLSARPAPGAAAPAWDLDRLRAGRQELRLSGTEWRARAVDLTSPIQITLREKDGEESQQVRFIVEGARDGQTYLHREAWLGLRYGNETMWDNAWRFAKVLGKVMAAASAATTPVNEPGYWSKLIDRVLRHVGLEERVSYSVTSRREEEASASDDEGTSAGA